MSFERFFTAYVECALRSSCDESREDGGDPLDDNYDADDIAPETLATMRKDCEAFYYDHEDDIELESDRAGHDFWLTRNGHGAGFWDGDWEAPLGTILTTASKAYGEFHLYAGDDGRVYGS